MDRSILILALIAPLAPLAPLAGCAMDGPEEARAGSIAPLAGPGEEGLSVDELSRVDVRGTATSIAMLAERVEELSDEERAQAAESLRILSVNCPYTRSAMQLPFALQAMVMGIPSERLDPFVQRDWEYLQEGLTAHVALLQALAVDLPQPVRGDHLHGHEGLIISRDHLREADDPLLITAALIHAIPALAEQVDEPTAELIERHSSRVEQATGIGRPCPRGPWAALPGQPWTLGMQLGGWHDALRRVAPFVEDAELRVAIDRVIEVLDAYGQAGIA